MMNKAPDERLKNVGICSDGAGTGCRSFANLFLVSLSEQNDHPAKLSPRAKKHRQSPKPKLNEEDSLMARQYYF